MLPLRFARLASAVLCLAVLLTTVGIPFVELFVLMEREITEFNKLNFVNNVEAKKADPGFAFTEGFAC